MLSKANAAGARSRPVVGLDALSDWTHPSASLVARASESSLRAARSAVANLPDLLQQLRLPQYQANWARCSSLLVVLSSFSDSGTRRPKSDEALD